MEKFRPAYPTPPDVVLKIVNYETEEGILLDGYLFEPAEKENRKVSGVSILLCHGLRDNGLGQVPSVIGQLLAKKGYTVLSINKRNSSTHHEQSVFEDSSKDIGGAMSFLIDRYPRGVVLIGHSLGCTELLYHAAQHPSDGVKGLVLVGSPSDIRGKSTLNYFKQSKNPEEAYRQFLSVAREMINEGNAEKLLDLPVELPDCEFHIPLSAKTFVSYRSPESNCSAIKWIGSVRAPMLLIGHESYWTLNEDNDEQVKIAREAARKCDYVYIRGATHYFENHYEDLITAICEWLGKIVER